jgi:hypothetical protein
VLQGLGLAAAALLATAGWGRAAEPAAAAPAAPAAAAPAAGAGAAALYPTAILPFQERGPEMRDQAAKVTDILFALLSADLNLVDRVDIDKALGEVETSASGLVDQNQAVQVGQLTGAKILITGSIMKVEKKTYLVAKIIGTETSRVVGASVKGDEKSTLDDLVEQLAARITETVSAKADELVAKPAKPEDRVAALKAKLGDGKRPLVAITVTERHVGQATIDPAAQTELIYLCKETGFEVIDPKAGKLEKANIVIEGEGFSEFALRRGNLVSVKARLEIKARDTATDTVIAVDRQTAIVVDLTEQIAGKAALEKAAADIAERLLPKLLKK